MIGELLDGKYKIEKKIGAGGFGIVYRATDTKLKRTVAVKVMNHPGADEGFRKRFMREAESLARMSHPNIVAVYDCGDFKDQPYLVMEYVNGPSLNDLIQRTELAVSHICVLAIQICEAMAYAHAQGIIHRDLTLKNILVSEGAGEDTRVKILDFGLVKILHSGEQSTGRPMMGTPTYMSPEQVLGAGVDGRADMFAFGVGIYRMLNGRYPFEAEHPAALMYMIVNELPGEFDREIPEGLRDIVLRCLEKDPRNRPRDFNEIAADFRTVQEKLGAAAKATTTSITNATFIRERSSKRNPYLNRVMIKNPNDFFGRSKEVRKIYSRLDAPHPQSISVVGDRRIGKSSLLNYIYNRRNRKRHMQNYENAIFVYLDFQRDVDFDVPRFIDFLFSVFGYETEEGKRYVGAERTLDQLKSAVQEIHETGKRIIILMDEFEVITKNEKFEEDFFSFLRSLANSYNVAYVTSSCDELQLMCHNKEISDSPFFNIFSNLPLRAFNSEEALELITVPSKTEGIPLEPHAGGIIELAGYFPLFLQVACSSVFEYLLDDPGKKPDWEQIAKYFKDEAFPHYTFYWERFGEAERENMRRFASGKSISKKYEFVNDNLLRRGFLVESDGGIRLFSSSFRSFIEQQAGVRRSRAFFLSSLFAKKRRSE